MKRKRLFRSLLAVTVAAFTLSLGACIRDVPVDPEPEHTHQWDSGTVTKEASCSEEGSLTYTCECGETKTAIIEKKDHVWGTEPTVKEATLEAEGETCWTCQNCGFVKKENTPKLSYQEMSVSDFIAALGEDVEEITATPGAMGVTLSDDGRTANVYGIKLTGEFSSECRMPSYITSVDLSGINTSEVTSMAFMFNECCFIEFIDLSVLDTSNVTDMSYMFADCEDINEVLMDNLDTSKVTTMEGMFEGCKAVEYFDFTGLDVSSLESMDCMFMDSGLKEFDLAGFEFPKLKSLDNMFTRCFELKEVDFTGFKTKSLESMEHTFSFCTKLVRIKMDGMDVSKVKSIQGIFIDAIILEYLTMSGCNFTSLENMNNLFGSNIKLTSFSLEPFENSANLKSMQETFAGMSRIKSFDLSKLNTSGVTNMARIFEGCASLTSVSLKGCNTSSLENVSYMFSNSDKLTDVDFTGCDFTAVKDYSYMFSFCTALRSLDLTMFNPAELGESSDYSDMFSDAASNSTEADPLVVKYRTKASGGNSPLEGCNPEYYDGCIKFVGVDITD